MIVSIARDIGVSMFIALSLQFFSLYTKLSLVIEKFHSGLDLWR